MVKMKNETSLQDTFSKRRSELFKKTSELSTLCGAKIAIIVYLPGRKAFSFDHPNVETIIDRFLNNNSPPPHQPNNLQPSEAHQNYIIQDLNNHLTQVMNQLESEKEKKNEELKKIRENSKMPENWREKPIEGLDLAQAYKFKGMLEILKKKSNSPHPNFDVRSTSNAPFGVDDGSNNFHVGNPSNASFGISGGNIYFHVGNSSNDLFGIDGSNKINLDFDHITNEFVPRNNMNYIPEFNRNHIMTLNEENEHHHDSHPPHYRSDYF
ncbi:hypothetical protein EUTSA_v10003315mg [Eutrema salsugineum]|uniref:MADS-box domain-containing protein n=1 Tax=Eutrema salsugineum TaxID=72664 RepID=V4LLQ8_EUTSA|nr:hypothetical protein EUTSA_v10003315mg [Eutrema salsugineum]